MNTDVNSLVKRYQALKTKKESLSRELLVAETNYKTLVTQYKEKQAEIFAKYNVKSIEELEGSVKEEAASLETLIKEAEAKLSILNVDSSISGDLLI